jgi:hypothetical protein
VDWQILSLKKSETTISINHSDNTVAKTFDARPDPGNSAVMIHQLPGGTQLADGNYTLHIIGNFGQGRKDYPLPIVLYKGKPYTNAQ